MEMSFVSTQKEHKSSSCCDSDFTDIELIVVDDAVCYCATVDNISSEVSACLYYACGYVAFKEKVCISCTAPEGQPSEFLDLVSRGLLSHSSAPLYAFRRSFFLFFHLSLLILTFLVVLIAWFVFFFV